MSRSAMVAWVAGVALAGALGVIAGGDWKVLAPIHDWWNAIVIGVTLYAAVTAALLIRRIVDPRLDTPILAVIAIVVFWLIEMFGDTGGTRTRDATGYRSSSSLSWSSGGKGMGLFGAIAGTIVALAFYGGGLAILIYEAKDKRAEAATPHVAAPAEKPAPSPSLPPGPPKIEDAADLTAAIALARPDLTDDRKAPSKGARELAHYLAAKGKWADLAVASNETSPALVEKDPMKEIGKRLCVAGTLARIEKATVDGTGLYTAQLMTTDGDTLEVYAVGPTGDLVKRSAARFCGVVASRLDTGGKAATFAVGMFDVPAEHP